jgi:hypothetical protein
MVPPELVEQETKVETPRLMEVLQTLKPVVVVAVRVASEAMQHLALLVMVEPVLHQLSPVQILCTLAVVVEESEQLLAVRVRLVAAVVREESLRRALPDHQILAAAVVALAKALSLLLATLAARAVQEL